MKNKSLLYHFIYGNRAVVICILFTLATMLDLLLCISQGIMDISYWHLGMRFILCIATSLSVLVFRFFEKLSLYAVIIMHFFISIGIMILFTWISSLYTEIHHNAYRDAVRTVVIIYPVIIVGCAFIDFIQTARANRILKKFQMKNKTL